MSTMRTRARAGCLLLSLACAAAHADSPALPRAYALPVGTDGAHIFVMLPGSCRPTQDAVVIVKDGQAPDDAILADPRMDDVSYRACLETTLEGAGGSAKSGDRRVRLHRWRGSGTSRSFRSSGGSKELAIDLGEYPVPGLYPGDGSHEPLWTVGWYADSVQLTADGRYLVRPGPWGGPLGVAFYDRGELLRAYPVRELVSDMDKLMYTVSHYFWIDEWRFIPHAARLHVRTLAGDQHVFDVSTGTIVSSRPWQPPRIAAHVLMADGSRVALSQVRLCGEASDAEWAFGMPGVDAPWKLVAVSSQEAVGEGTAVIRMVNVDLGDVVRLEGDEAERETGSDVTGGRWFRLLLRDGRMLRVAIPQGAALCGTGTDGRPAERAFGAISAVRVCADAAGSGCPSP